MDIIALFDNEKNKYIDLLPNVLLNEKSLEDDPEKENQVEKSITKIINKNLDHAATFCQGLYLFDKFIPTLSKENLAKYFPHWISKLTQKLSNGNPQEYQSVCKSIGVLITSCRQEPDLDKKISLYHVKQFLGLIIELHDKNPHISLLNLLTVILYHYPESCGRLQVSFSKIFSSSLDCQDNNLVNASAKCYALLVRANERQFINSHKATYVILPDNSSASCHIYYQLNLCYYLNEIMDTLFQNFITTTTELPIQIIKKAKNNNILYLPELPEKDLLEYYAATANRFNNICTFLCILLKIGNPERKFALPNVILYVTCRGLSITPANFKKNDKNRDLLLLILPKLHGALLNVLEALITSFQQDLIPFASNIQKIILQTLNWTQTFYNELFKDTRTQAYKLLSVWMNETRSLSAFELVADEVLLHILKDISQSNAKVQMLKSNKSTKNNSKADKDEKSGSNGAMELNARNYPDTILRIQILSTVELIISNASCCLKQSFYERIRNAIVLLLYDQYMKKTKISTDKNNVKYRLHLLKSLRVLETYTQASSSTSYAIHLFEVVISQESNSEIIAEARLGLAELRHIIYPTAPSLMLSLEATESSSAKETLLFQTSKLEDLVPIKPTQQIPEVRPPAQTLQKDPETDPNASTESEQQQHADNVQESVQEASEVEFDAPIQSKRAKLDEISDSSVVSNGLSSQTNPQENANSDQEDMLLEFHDIESSNK